MELLVWWTGNKAKSSRLRRAMIMWIVDGWWSDGDDGLRNWNGQMAIGVKCNGKSVSWLLLFLFFLHWKVVTSLVGTYLNLRFVALVGSSRPSSVVMVRNNRCGSRRRSWFGITGERLNYGLIGDCISCSNKWLIKIWFLIFHFQDPVSTDEVMKCSIELRAAEKGGTQLNHSNSRTEGNRRAGEGDRERCSTDSGNR